MTQNVNDPFTQRIAQVEQEGKAARGEHWDRAVKGLQRQMDRSDAAHITGADPLTHADVLQRVARADASARLFSDGISGASEEDWRAWRDSLPDRQRWRDRQR
jgi:hypothetical protein